RFSRGKLPSDFQCKSSLSFNDSGIIKWGHHNPVITGCVFLQGSITSIKNITDKANLNKITAESACFIDFLLRCRHRHKNHAFTAKVTTGESKTLRVIAGGSAYKNCILRYSFHCM